MKTVRPTEGPFAERPHFKPSEIDSICSDELKKAGLMPTSPEPVRIDRFITKRFGVQPEYEDLPDGVLGFTEFCSTGVRRVVLSRALGEDDSDVACRRERATLAHEAGHGLLHGHLFALADLNRTSLFGTANCTASQILCREVLLEQSARANAKPVWSEYQANQAIGSLLLPRRLVRIAVQSMLTSSGGLGGVVLESARRGDAERLLAQVFDVNPIVARLRLDAIFGARDNTQLLL